MAEHADDGFLLYLLDMAILEANRRFRSMGESLGNAGAKEKFSKSDDDQSTNDLVAELRIVR